MPPKLGEGSHYYTSPDGDYAEITGTRGPDNFEVTMHDLDRSGREAKTRAVYSRGHIEVLLNSGEWAADINDLSERAHRRDPKKELLSFALDRNGERLLNGYRVLDTNGHLGIIKQIYKEPDQPLKLARLKVLRLPQRKRTYELNARDVRVRNDEFKPFTGPLNKPKPGYASSGEDPRLKPGDQWYVAPEYLKKYMEPQRGKTRWWRVGDHVKVGGEDWYITYFHKGLDGKHKMQAVLDQASSDFEIDRAVDTLWRHLPDKPNPAPVQHMTREIFGGAFDMARTSVRRRLPRDREDLSEEVIARIREGINHNFEETGQYAHFTRLAKHAADKGVIEFKLVARNMGTGYKAFRPTENRRMGVFIRVAAANQDTVFSSGRQLEAMGLAIDADRTLHYLMKECNRTLNSFLETNGARSLQDYYKTHGYPDLSATRLLSEGAPSGNIFESAEMFLAAIEATENRVPILHDGTIDMHHPLLAVYLALREIERGGMADPLRTQNGIPPENVCEFVADFIIIRLLDIAEVPEPEPEPFEFPDGVFVNSEPFGKDPYGPHSIAHLLRTHYEFEAVEQVWYVGANYKTRDEITDDPLGSDNMWCCCAVLDPEFNTVGLISGKWKVDCPARRALVELNPQRESARYLHMFCLQRVERLQGKEPRRVWAEIPETYVIVSPETEPSEPRIDRFRHMFPDQAVFVGGTSEETDFYGTLKEAVHDHIQKLYTLDYPRWYEQQEHVFPETKLPMRPPKRKRKRKRKFKVQETSTDTEAEATDIDYGTDVSNIASRRHDRFAKKQRVEGELSDLVVTMRKNKLRPVPTPRGRWSDDVLQEDGRVQLYRDLEGGPDIDYVATARALYQELRSAAASGHPNSDVDQLGFGVSRTENRVIEMSTLRDLMAIVGTGDASMAKHLLFVEGKQSGLWGFEGQLVVAYTVAQLYLWKWNPPQGNVVFNPASAYIQFHYPDDIHEYRLAMLKIMEVEKSKLGENAELKLSAIRDMSAREAKAAKISKDDRRAMWRYYRADKMSEDRTAKPFGVLIDYIEPSAEPTARERALPHEEQTHETQVWHQLKFLEDLIKESGDDRPSTPQSVGTAFIVAVAAGVALILWESIV